MEDTVTWWVAIYGAGLSTAVVAWEIFKYIREQSRLKVRCYIATHTVTPIGTGGGIVYEGGSDEGGANDPFLAFHVINSGGRDIIVTKVGGGSKNGTIFKIINDGVSMPKTLAPGEFIDLSYSLAVINEDVTFLGAWDSHEKLWKARRKVLKQVKSDVQTIRGAKKQLLLRKEQ